MFPRSTLLDDSVDSASGADSGPPAVSELTVEVFRANGGVIELEPPNPTGAVIDVVPENTASPGEATRPALPAASPGPLPPVSFAPVFTEPSVLHHAPVNAMPPAPAFVSAPEPPAEKPAAVALEPVPQTVTKSAEPVARPTVVARGVWLALAGAALLALVGWAVYRARQQ